MTPEEYKKSFRRDDIAAFVFRCCEILYVCWIVATPTWLFWVGFHDGIGARFAFWYGVLILLIVVALIVGRVALEFMCGGTYNFHKRK